MKRNAASRIELSVDAKRLKVKGTQTATTTAILSPTTTSAIVSNIRDKSMLDVSPQANQEKEK